MADKKSKNATIFLMITPYAHCHLKEKVYNGVYCKMGEFATAN